MGRPRKTNQKFIQEVYEAVGDEYSFLEPYQGTMVKIKAKHNDCGYEWLVKPTQFLDLRGRCPKCSGSMKKTDKQFKSEVYQLVGNEYTFLETYKNNSTKLKVIHNTCGHEYRVESHAFTVKESRCPKCAKKKANKKLTKTNKEFMREVYSLVRDEYLFLEKYKGSSNKIKVRHNSTLCSNHEYSVRPNSFLHKGDRCPECKRLKSRKTSKKFEKQVKELVGSEYDVVKPYTVSTVKVGLRHNSCIYEYEVMPSSFLSGVRCPKCNESKGERRVAEYLDENGITYIREKSFTDCRHIHPLPFDFAIYDGYDKIIGIVEYDGSQHFEPKFGEVPFAHTQRNDKIKNDYCERNDIPLLRIPYTEFEQIENILDRFLSSIEERRRRR